VKEADDRVERRDLDDVRHPDGQDAPDEHGAEMFRPVGRAIGQEHGGGR
jgi:hypothetical protein